MIDFLNYYATGSYAKKEVELIINGDFLIFWRYPSLNFLTMNFGVRKQFRKIKNYFRCSQNVIDALIKFLSKEKKKLVYIVGNHDGEFLFESMRKYFKDLFPENSRKDVIFRFEKDGEYSPGEGIIIKHGHEYEIPNQIDPEGSIISTHDGRKYFLPPWGSYYVTRVINKFKEERPI